MLNVTKIFIRHHYTLKSFTYGEKNYENSTVGESSNKWTLGIILWHHNTCKFNHLWRRLFISEMLVSVYIKFYHATSHVVTDNQKKTVWKHLTIVYDTFYNSKKIRDPWATSLIWESSGEPKNPTNTQSPTKYLVNERKSEQAHIPHAPTLLENAVYNEWQFQALGTGNWTKKGI